MTKQRKWVRARIPLAIALPAALVAWVALAGTTSTLLPNGAELQVSIDDPVTSTEFLVPADQMTIDVDVTGTASIGLGEADATIVYVMDVSGTTDGGSGTGCSPILDCEQDFVRALNQAVMADGSCDEVGLVVYASSAATADMSHDAGDQLLTTPDAPGTPPFIVDEVVNSTFSDWYGGDGGVAECTYKPVGQMTNCLAGLQAALTLVTTPPSTNNTKMVVFVSDGLCNWGGPIAPAVDDLADEGAVIHSIAAGTGSSCDDDPEGYGTLRDMATGTGGHCFEVPDPGDLPDIIPHLIGSTLEGLEMEMDGGGMQPIPDTAISLPLPQAGAVSVTYDVTETGLGPGDHEICVAAEGSDSTGGSDVVTQCETIHLLKLTAALAEETNELGSDNEHTVTATILGDAAQIAGRTVDFAVLGQNAGAAGLCSPNADCTTDASGQVSFTYTVPVTPASLGTDTIEASTQIAGQSTAVELTKHWIDSTPPLAQCQPSVNPHGKQVPAADKSNQDGFYMLMAADDVWPAEALEMYLTDTASGMVFGPFAVGDTIKYTQAPGAKPGIKDMGSSSGKADAVVAHIICNGDAMLTAMDGSGNASAPAFCVLVAPPPK